MSRMRLEEVTDEYDLQQDDQYTDVSGSDSDSDVEDDGEDGPLEETLLERISALRDMVPPPTRAKLSNAFATTKYGVSTVALYGGKTLWAITASLLLLGIPFMMAVETEAQAQEEEKAMQMQAGANDVLAPGSQSNVFNPPQQAPQGVRPPGF